MLSLLQIGLVVYIAVCLLAVYLCFFNDGDALFIAGRLEWVKDRLYSELYAISPSLATSVKNWANYLVNEPNPVMQCMYLSIVLTAWTGMVVYGYPQIDTPFNRFINPIHCKIGYIVYAVCLYTFYRACTVPAGDLRKETIRRYDNYPYDNVLYTARDCKTLKFRKVARSKFDRSTKRHIPRFDHFCVWLNQPVGEENYRDFLLFLLVHCGMLSYGAWATSQIIRNLVVTEGLFHVSFLNVKTQETVKASYFVIFKYLSNKFPAIICLFILSSVMGLVMIGFTAFHLWICSRGMTTNEYFKWKDIWSWHKSQTAAYAKARTEGRAGKRWSKEGKDYEVVDGWVDVATLEGVDDDDDDKDVGCVGASANPGVEREQKKGKGEGEKKKEEELVQDPGPLPKNIYNNGVKENFKEVLFPRSFRSASQHPIPPATTKPGEKKKKSS
mmetsp:Transcript_7004/g.14139  ORF Transcript_7004/g.14139 Transcript_7004/m.14139 type:complete len:442 (-) Transcript_7004:4464-5789(-)